MVRLLAVAIEQEVPYCGVGNNRGGGASRKSANMIKTPSRPKSRGGVRPHAPLPSPQVDDIVLDLAEQELADLYLQHLQTDVLRALRGKDPRYWGGYQRLRRDAGLRINLRHCAFVWRRRRGP